MEEDEGRGGGLSEEEGRRVYLRVDNRKSSLVQQTSITKLGTNSSRSRNAERHVTSGTEGLELCSHLNSTLSNNSIQLKLLEEQGGVKPGNSGGTSSNGDALKDAPDPSEVVGHIESVGVVGARRGGGLDLGRPVKTYQVGARGKEVAGGGWRHWERRGDGSRTWQISMA